jgi:hypothetical protein
MRLEKWLRPVPVAPLGTFGLSSYEGITENMFFQKDDLFKKDASRKMIATCMSSSSWDLRVVELWRNYWKTFFQKNNMFPKQMRLEQWLKPVPVAPLGTFELSSFEGIIENMFKKMRLEKWLRLVPVAPLGTFGLSSYEGIIENMNFAKTDASRKMIATCTSSSAWDLRVVELWRNYWKHVFSKRWPFQERCVPKNDCDVYE